jgi:hypothetical protein
MSGRPGSNCRLWFEGCIIAGDSDRSAPMLQSEALLPQELDIGCPVYRFFLYLPSEAGSVPSSQQGGEG